MKNNKVFSQK